ncbi:MAG: hypothetical protein QXN16_04085 [Candidatus Micrarchaeaceae archaeon]
MRNQTPNEPYGFSITYQESVNELFTMLTGYKLVPRRDAENNIIPGEYVEVQIPNSFPLLTKEGGYRAKQIFEMNFDKFNPIGNITDHDCAMAASEVERRLAQTITLNADRYIYEYEKDPSAKLSDWDAFLKQLSESLYRFATLAKNGHFINFAKAIMGEQVGYQPEAQPERHGILRQLFKRPRSPKDVNYDNASMYENY